MPQSEVILLNAIKNKQNVLFSTGLPGNTWYVNQATGSDSNSGSLLAPFASLTAAQNAAMANNNDVVYLIGQNNQTTTLNWAKNGVHLIGLTAPSNNDRARITPITDAQGMNQAIATALYPLVNVTAQGCIFKNISAFYGFDGTLTPPASSICWQDTGGRNSYDGCQFIGFGDAKMAVLAGARALALGGNNGERTFTRCRIGGDTETRATAANATLEYLAAAGSPRDLFEDCIFDAYSTLATNCHVLVSSGGLDRYVQFKRCFFHTFGGTAMNALVLNDGGSPAGDVAFLYSSSIGATAIATTGAVYVDGASAATFGATIGLAVAAT